MKFDLEQLKRDNGRCLYNGRPAYAHQMPDGMFAVNCPRLEAFPNEGSFFETDLHLQNLPRKHVVTVWGRRDGGRVAIIDSIDTNWLDGGWTKLAVSEITEGEGLEEKDADKTKD